MADGCILSTTYWSRTVLKRHVQQCPQMVVPLHPTFAGLMLAKEPHCPSWFCLFWRALWKQLPGCPAHQSSTAGLKNHTLWFHNLFPRTSASNQAKTFSHLSAGHFQVAPLQLGSIWELKCTSPNTSCPYWNINKSHPQSVIKNNIKIKMTLLIAYSIFYKKHSLPLWNGTGRRGERSIASSSFRFPCSTHHESSNFPALFDEHLFIIHTPINTSPTSLAVPWISSHQNKCC